MSKGPEGETSPQEIVTTIMRWIFEIDSGQDWELRELHAVPVPEGVRYSLLERGPRGDYRESDLLTGVSADAVLGLQQLMYDPRGGAWLDATFEVTSQGSADARFNYEDPPVLVGPRGETPAMSPQDATAQLQAFPRPDDAVPDWMRPA